MSRTTSSPITPKRAYRYSIAHFDFHPNSLPRSRIPVPIRRWTGKWHATPVDSCCCCDETTTASTFCDCYHHSTLIDDDMIPLCPLAVPASASKTHVKSAFPEYELEELPTPVSSRASTPVLRYENVGYSSPVSSAAHSVRFERDDDVWSTIAISSVKERDEIVVADVGEIGKEVEEVVKRRLTIDKIEGCGSIAKKQKIRKQSSSSSSGEFVPSKTKRFFNSIRHVFRSKTKKSSPLAAIEFSSMNESPDTDVEIAQPEESSETVVENNDQLVTENTEEMSSTTVEEQTTLTTQSLPSPLPTIEETDSLREEYKENVMPVLTSPVLPAAANEIPAVIVSDTWHDKNIVVKRTASPPPSSFVSRHQNRHWSTIDASSTISRQTTWQCSRV